MLRLPTPFFSLTLTATFAIDHFQIENHIPGPVRVSVQCACGNERCHATKTTVRKRYIYGNGINQNERNRTHKKFEEIHGALWDCGFMCVHRGFVRNKNETNEENEREIK